jgi:hypothetical protein
MSERKAAEGDRVRDFDDDLGIGTVLSVGANGVVACFTTVSGCDLTKTLVDPYLLPEAIVARVKCGNAWTEVDVTDAVLALSVAEISLLRDGPVAPALTAAVPDGASEIQIRGAVVGYFGLGSTPGEFRDGVHPADLAQAARIRTAATSHPAP